MKERPGMTPAPYVTVNQNPNLVRLIMSVQNAAGRLQPTIQSQEGASVSAVNAEARCPSGKFAVMVPTS